MQRKTDVASTKRFQTDRYFLSEGSWFFTTREGVNFGPFSIREDGEKACVRYIETQHVMGKLRARDPVLDEHTQWDDQDVANAAKEVSNWRLDREGRPNTMYADRSDKHK